MAFGRPTITRIRGTTQIPRENQPNRAMFSPDTSKNGSQMLVRRRSFAFGALGTIAIATAVSLHYWIGPAVSRLPADMDSTAEYVGTTAHVDPATKQLGTPQEITASTRARVVSATGSAAVIEVVSTTNAGTSSSVDHRKYAIDRTDLTRAPAPQGIDVTDQRDGVVLARPRDPGRDPFTVYNPVIEQALPVGYVDTSQMNGRTVYQFTGTTTAPIADPDLLAQLQNRIGQLAPGDGRTLPKAALHIMAAGLAEPQRTQFLQLLSTLPDQVPLAYTATVQPTLWLDAALGTPIKSSQAITTTLAIAGPTVIPLIPLTHTQLAQTPSSVQQSAEQAASNAAKLDWINDWGPLTLAVIGILFLGVSLATARRSRVGTTPEVVVAVAD